MGVIQDNKGNLELAIELYKKFIAKYPMQQEAYANLSYAYFRLKQYDKAIETNKQALRVMPHSFNPIINIAKTFMQINEPDSALHYFEMAHAIAPNEPNVNNAIEKLRKK
jgi:tetratricopeptide (TPR) repeat protein